MEYTAPVIAVSRLRMKIDGPGITTLVCFHGCPLRCHWCINPFSFAAETKRNHMTAQQLYEQVKLDELYFLSTGGGITFGGGEPILYPVFLQEFRQICGGEWHLCAETSLSVPGRMWSRQPHVSTISMWIARIPTQTSTAATPARIIP